MAGVTLLVSLVILCNSQLSIAAVEKKQLYFSFITAMSGGSTSSGGIPIIDFALEQINNDSRLLPNYTLNYTTVLDSKVYYIYFVLHTSFVSKKQCKVTV